MWMPESGGFWVAPVFPLLPALLMSRRLPVFPVLRVLPIPLHFPGLWGPPVVWMILSPVRIRVP